MYRVFWLTLAGFAAIGIAVDLVTRGAPPELLVGIIGFAAASLFGFLGTYFYSLHARRKIEHLANKGHLDPDALTRAGGVSWLAVVVFVTVDLALTLLELAF